MGMEMDPKMLLIGVCVGLNVGAGVEFFLAPSEDPTLYTEEIAKKEGIITDLAADYIHEKGIKVWR